jgi:galactonate dehydratase
MAKVLLHELEPFHPMFVEEPVLPENLHVLPHIAQGLGYPIATGERLFHRSQFRPILESGAVDIVQPDISHCGGITEIRRSLRWPRPMTSPWRRTVRWAR